MGLTHVVGEVFEMITGIILFRPRPEKVWGVDVSMLLQMCGYLNPPDLLAAGQRTHDFFDNSGVYPWDYPIYFTVSTGTFSPVQDVSVIF